MPYTVAVSFDNYFEAINLPGDHRETANARRDDIVASLKGKMTVLEAFATGSIPRYTALRGRADLDVIAVLHYGNHIKDKTPTQVLQALRDALAEYRTNVRKNGQAVTLHYKTWPNVDIVPASRVVDSAGNVTHFSIPSGSAERWTPTNPKAHSADIDERASECGMTFRRLIKMMKHWSQGHSDYLQSYHIEVLALRALSGRLDDVPWHAFQFFEKARGLVQAPLWHNGAFVDGYLSYTDRQEITKRLDKAAATARNAWYYSYPPLEDHQTAIRLWRQLLGDAFPAYG